MDKQLSENISGVSTVIGVVILIGIVVLLSALVGAFAFKIFDTGQDSAFAGVTMSQTSGTLVEVRVDSMGDADRIQVQTAGGKQVITEPGIYTYESYGKEVVVVGYSNEEKQLLNTFTPEVDSNEVSNVLIVNSDGTVQSSPGEKQFDTLKQAKQEADAGDIIRFESGTHIDPQTVNQTVNKQVTVVAEDGTVFSCRKTDVELKLKNATMSRRSAFIQTQDCSFQEIEYPSPPSSGGSVDVLSGGSDTTSSNPNRGESSTGVKTGGDGTAEEFATSDKSVTIRISSMNQYSSITVRTEAGKRTINTTGVYNIETFGYNATVIGNPRDGEGSVTIDKIIAEEQNPEITSSTTQNGTSVSESNKVPVDMFIVQSDNNTTTPAEEKKNVKYVQTLSKADSLASDGDLIRLQSGIHTDPGTVSTSISSNITLALSDNTELSCKEVKIDLSLGEATLSENSPFPSVTCDEYSTVTQDSVRKSFSSESSSKVQKVSSGSIEKTKFNSSSTISLNSTIVRDIESGKNNLYIAGSTYEPSPVLRLLKSGNTSYWSTTITQKSGYVSNIIATQSTVVVTGHTKVSGTKTRFISKVTSDGNVKWTREFSKGRVSGISVGPGENYYVVSRYKPRLYKFNKNGEMVYNKSINVPGMKTNPVDVLSHKNGFVYTISSCKNTAKNYCVSKYKPNGELIWREIDRSSYRNDPADAEIGYDGNIYVTGKSKINSNGGDTDYRTLKINSTNGDIMWKKEIGNNAYDRGYHIEAGSNGTLLVAGENGRGEMTLYKHSSQTGQVISKSVIEAPYDKGIDVEVSPVGDIIVANGYRQFVRFSK